MFEKADALAKLMDKGSEQDVSYQTLLKVYQNTTISSSDYVRKIDIARYLDILRHEYVTAICDMKVWKIRTGDSYPDRRLKEMEKFLKDFDESVQKGL